MTKEEFIKIINENITEDEKAVVFLEAFDDYVKANDTSEYEKRIAEITSERDSILKKYRDRFSEGNTVDEPDNGVHTEYDDEQEDEIIDVKELS